MRSHLPFFTTLWGSSHEALEGLRIRSNRVRGDRLGGELIAEFPRCCHRTHRLAFGPSSAAGAGLDRFMANFRLTEIKILAFASCANDLLRRGSSKPDEVTATMVRVRASLIVRSCSAVSGDKPLPLLSKIHAIRAASRSLLATAKSQ